MSLQDVMTVAADAARLSKRDIKNAKARAKRAAAKAAVVMNAEIAKEVAAKPSTLAALVPAELLTTQRKPAKQAKAKKVATPVASPASEAPKPVVVTPAAPVKVTVKQMVLDCFYAVPGTQFSTLEAVMAIQAKHPGTNESSIRVWISDFQRDGSVKLVKRDGRQVILKAGKLGKFAKGYNPPAA